MALLFTALLPLAAYTFVWPLLLALPLLALRPDGEPAPLPLVLLSLAALACLLAPTYYLLVQVGSIHPPRMASYGAALTALGMLLLQPHLASMRSRRPFGTAWVSGGVSVRCWRAPR